MNKMTKRSIKYFKIKRMYRRLGFTSWALDWIKQSHVIPKPYMAIMMPGGKLTHFGGSDVLLKPEYFNPPPIRVNWHHPNDGFIPGLAQGITTPSSGLPRTIKLTLNTDNTELVDKLLDAMNERKAQRDDDERSVATGDQ